MVLLSDLLRTIIPNIIDLTTDNLPKEKYLLRRFQPSENGGFKRLFLFHKNTNELMWVYDPQEATEYDITEAFIMKFRSERSEALVTVVRKQIEVKYFKNKKS